MPNLYNAGQILTIIRNLGQNDIEDLGPNESAQNTAIFTLMNVAMWKNAKLFNQIKYSDSQTINADGFVTFQQGGMDISNLFEPMMIYNPDSTAPSSTEIMRRTSETSPYGWWRDAENQEVHIRGIGNKYTAGSYALKYIKYPKQITLDSDTVECPPSGYDALIKDVLSLVKYARNSYNGAEFMDVKAKQSYSSLVQGSNANIRGGS